MRLAESPNCMETVEKCWQPSLPWIENIRHAQSELSGWSKKEFGFIPVQIRKKQQLLNNLMNDPNLGRVSGDIKKVETTRGRQEGGICWLECFVPISRSNQDT
ncbi:hypothetical protein ACFE04_030832 [Oxalis oulophora]